MLMGCPVVMGVLCVFTVQGSDYCVLEMWIV